jgi:uncharacterized membrane protein
MSTDKPDRRRLSEMLAPLAAGEELARRRVWNRVQAGVSARETRARRNRWLAGGGAAVAASLAIFVVTLTGGSSQQAPHTASSEQVALGAVLEMLGASPDGLSEGQAMEQFVSYLVTEAQATPQ